MPGRALSLAGLVQPLHSTAWGAALPAGKGRRQDGRTAAAYRGGVPGPDALPLDWDDEDPDPDDESLPPYWFAGQALPQDPAKPLHRWTAWFLLVVFGLPVVFAVVRVVLYL